MTAFSAAAGRLVAHGKPTIRILTRGRAFSIGGVARPARSDEATSHPCRCGCARLWEIFFCPGSPTCELGYVLNETIPSSAVLGHSASPVYFSTGPMPESTKRGVWCYLSARECGRAVLRALDKRRRPGTEIRDRHGRVWRRRWRCRGFCTLGIQARASDCRRCTRVVREERRLASVGQALVNCAAHGAQRNGSGLSLLCSGAVLRVRSGQRNHRNPLPRGRPT